MPLAKLLASGRRLFRRHVYRSHKPPSPNAVMPTVDPELTSRLGQIAINWSIIEEWLGHLLANLIDADPGGLHVLTNNMGASNVIKSIQTVISIFEPKEPNLALVRELIAEADKLREERNILVHGLWDATDTDAGSAFVDTAGWNRAEIIHSRLVTTRDLDEFLVDLQDWVNDFVTLGKRFGFPRSQGETKSIFA